MTKLVDPVELITKDVHSVRETILSPTKSVPSAFNDEYWSLGYAMRLPSEYTKSILSRDLNTCRFCGFHSKKYQQIVVRNAKEWLLDSVLTACIFCSQNLSFTEVPKMRSGVLIYLPEISQVKLNQILKIIYACRISQGTAADKARAALDKLIARRKKADVVLTDRPDVLIKEIRGCQTEESYQKLCSDIRDFRMLPLDRKIVQEADLEFNQFPQILAYWRSKDGPFARVPPENMDLTEFDAILDALG